MARSTQHHPDDLIAAGYAHAVALLAAHNPARLPSEFLGALGERAACCALGARHASHLRDECDLERGEVAIEVKATARPAIKPVSLAGKICDEVCYVRFKQQGTTLAVVEIRIRPRATGPGVKCRTTWLIGGPDSNGTPYQVVP